MNYLNIQMIKLWRRVWIISKEMCQKHKIFGVLMFTVFGDKQAILVDVYWLGYNFNNININGTNYITEIVWTFKTIYRTLYYVLSTHKLLTSNL